MWEKKGKINCDISYSAYERSSNRNPDGMIRSFLGRRAFSPKVNRSGKLKGQNLFWFVCNILNQQSADIAPGFPVYSYPPPFLQLFSKSIFSFKKNS
jgi:hypothetical protein